MNWHHLLHESHMAVFPITYVVVSSVRVGLNVLGLIFKVIEDLSKPLNASGSHDEIIKLDNDQSCTKANNYSNASLFSNIAADNDGKH